jgi:hypothetical protein
MMSCIAPPSHPAMCKPKLLNNEACRFIQSRKYDEAIASLMKALKLAKSTAEDHKARLSDSFCDSHGSSSQEVEAVSPQEFRQCVIDSMMMIDPDSSSSGPYIYRTPVFIPSLHGDESVATLSFVLMVNLSLSHHLKSIDLHGQESQKALEIAKRLYELTFQMQAQEVQTNLILTSALLNNLSIVHTSLENQYEARQCDQLLLSTLLLLIDIGGATPETESVLSGFMDNVMHLIGVQSAAASAA